MERITEIFVVLENKPSVLGELYNFLAENDINIEYCYGTLSRKGDTTSVILDVSDIDKAIEILSAK